jgi:membrane fusion protein (multidrug efflux system)
LNVFSKSCIKKNLLKGHRPFSIFSLSSKLHQRYKPEAGINRPANKLMFLFKRIVLALLGLAVVVGALAGAKYFQIKGMIAQGQNFVPPPGVVTTAGVKADRWESFLTAVGSLEAVQGVEVTAELPGKVVRIAFEPGTKVSAGELLVQQDTSVELAQQRAAEAAVALARLNLARARELVATKTISQSTFDNADTQFKQAEAQLDNINAIVAKKTIRAPFSGRLGIRQVNLGQNLKEGEPIVTLQTMDPIYANFLMPQQQLAQVKKGLRVRLAMDALPGQMVEGVITTINPLVDDATRNFRIQATVANPEENLRPGMYVNVTLVLPETVEVLAVPATAVLYAPYGDSVFVVEEKKAEGAASSGLFLRQQFIRTGEKRGDFVSVVSGLKGGETVVSTGVFKLRNGQAVVVDNTLSPEFKKSPTPADA